MSTECTPFGELQYKVYILGRTTGLVQKHCGNQELPGVVEQGFLYKVEWRTWGCPLLEDLPPGGAKS